MAKKKFGQSFLLSFLTHLFLFAVLLFASYFVGREVSDRDLGGGHGAVWVDLKAVQPGSAGGSVAPSRETRKPDPSAKAQAKVPSLAPPKQRNSDAVSLRQERPLPKMGERKESEGSAEGGSGGGASSVPGTGSGGREGSGSGGGTGSGSPSVLNLIRKKIEQAKRYPALAKARKLEGIVRLEFKIDGNGQIQGLTLLQSSGFPILDEEGLATVRRAAPLPSYPHAIQISLKFEIR